MPRPKKTDEAKRDKRLTVYMSEGEEAALRDVSERQERPMTQVVTEALRDWLMRLLEPPESLRTARYEAVMNEDSVMVRGFVCQRGHVFWVDWVEPMDPHRCPLCGSESNMKKTWGGTVKRGV